MIQTLQVWKKVQIGTHKSSDELSKELTKDDDRAMNYAALDMMRNIAVAGQLTEVNLVLVTAAQLGFPNQESGGKWSDICSAAFSSGLELCSAEVAPQLRRQYPDQPKGEGNIWVATEPVMMTSGGPHIFCVGHDHEGLWLRGAIFYSNGLWWDYARFAFARPG